MYELIIIGGGPAGAAGGVYAARKQIKTALIAESFGGQSFESLDIQNWIGTVSISGVDLAKSFKEHVKKYAGEYVDIKEGERVVEIERSKEEKIERFIVKTNKGEYRTKTVLVATGGQRRKLNIPGAKEYEGKGITYCASCDGPFFKDRNVAVIGGGNAGFETALQLLAYCKFVTLISRGEFKADPSTVDKVQTNPKAKLIPHAVPVKIEGDNFVKSLTYRTSEPVDQEIKIDTEGIFVEIGHTPATGFVEGLVEMDEFKRIKINHKTQETSAPGIWAAGDATDTLYHQNNIAAGDAVKAVEDIYLRLA